mgnify:CR=1 FL=1
MSDFTKTILMLGLFFLAFNSYAFGIEGYKQYKLNIPIKTLKSKGMKCDSLGCEIKVNDTFGGARVNLVRPYAENGVVNRMTLEFDVSSMVLKKLLEHHFGKPTYSFKDFQSDGSVDTRHLWVADNGASYYVFIQGAVNYQDEYWVKNGSIQVINKAATKEKIDYWKGDF